jgi:hypothetical protein
VGHGSLVFNLKLHEFFQTHAPDYQYYQHSYTEEPMLELLLIAKDCQSDTRYKVLFQITTPLMLWYPHIVDGKSPKK